MSARNISRYGAGRTSKYRLTIVVDSRFRGNDGLGLGGIDDRDAKDGSSLGGNDDRGANDGSSLGGIDDLGAMASFPRKRDSIGGATESAVDDASFVLRSGPREMVLG